MYSGFQITMLIMLAPFVIGAFAYGLWPRKTKNLLYELIPAWKKRYVVCHMIYQAGLSDIFNVIPNAQGLTKVGNYSYDLKDKYITLVYKKRPHFVLDENNAIPQHFEKQTNDSIIFQASEIQTALENTVMDYLFSKKKELLIMGLFLLGIVCLGAIIYNVYMLSTIQQTLQSIASNPTVTVTP